METIVLGVALMGTLMLMMALGVIFSGRELKGSCGGADGECMCAAAGDSPGSCSTEDPSTSEPKELKPRAGADGVIIYE